MASENVEDFDLPLPVSETESDDEDEEVDPEVQRNNENLQRLKVYVNRFAYPPVPPPNVRPRTAQLAQAKKMVIMDNKVYFGDVFQPKERGERFERIAGRYTALSTEQLERIIKSQKAKDRRKENLLKRKQEIYYDMLTKLERQCRSQYLNVLIKKFANFITKLATTMRIPSQLVEPYSRMQRGIFCNILLAIGVQPSSHEALSYNTPEAMHYEVAHKLAHAFLSLIIKALNSAATKSPDDIKGIETDFDMDNYIKDRLMVAAGKKIMNERNQAKNQTADDPLIAMFKQCSKFPAFK